MNKSEKGKIVLKESALLLRQGVITVPQYQDILCLYPQERWDWQSLGRWFLFFGSIATAIGGGILFQEFVGFTLKTLALLLGFMFVGLLWGAKYLKANEYQLSARSLELLSAFDLIGFTFTVGIIYSTGSGNWPALILIDLLIILPLSYLLHNQWLLVLSMVLVFTWFGGVTGYLSGWGAYFFGMNYPLRFVAASGAMILCAYIHLFAEKGILSSFRNFFKIWLSSGLFFGEMALWLLSIFGNYGMMENYLYKSSSGEILLYNLAWAIVNIAAIFIGSKQSITLMVGYGATFLIIQGYTLYFSYLGNALHPFISFIIAGASALFIALKLEKRLKRVSQS